MDPKQRLLSSIEGFLKGEIPAEQLHWPVAAELDRAGLGVDIINTALNDLEYAIYMFGGEDRIKEVLRVLHMAVQRIEDQN